MIYYSIEILHGVTAIILTYHPHHAKLQVLPMIFIVIKTELLTAFHQDVQIDHITSRTVISQELFTNLPLPQNVLDRREVATKERKK